MSESNMSLLIWFTFVFSWVWNVAIWTACIPVSRGIALHLSQLARPSLESMADILWLHRMLFSFGIFCLTLENLPHLSGHQTAMPASSWCCQKIKSHDAWEGSSYSMRQSVWQGVAGEDMMAEYASDPFFFFSWISARRAQHEMGLTSSLAHLFIFLHALVWSPPSSGESVWNYWDSGGLFFCHLFLSLPTNHYFISVPSYQISEEPLEHPGHDWMYKWFIARWWSLQSYHHGIYFGYKIWLKKDSWL